MSALHKQPDGPRQEGHSSTSPSNPVSHTFLVVDKDDISQYLSKELLHFDGHSVYTAESGKKGLELFSLHYETISPVLCDAVCVIEESALFWEAIRRRKPAVIIVMTATAQEINNWGPLVQEYVMQILVKPYNTTGGCC